MTAKKIEDYIEIAGTLLAHRKLGLLSRQAYSSILTKLARIYNEFFWGSHEEVIGIYRSVKREAEKIIDEGAI